jgi:biopolymer transport protein ExbD
MELLLIFLMVAVPVAVVGVIVRLCGSHRSDKEHEDDQTGGGKA